MLVSKLLLSSFQISASLNDELHKKWINLSFKLGAKLPNSLLTTSIQRAGRLDMLLRGMEGEQVSKLTDKSSIEGPDFSFEYLCFFSELWIGHTYEIFRVLQDHKRDINFKDGKRIFHDLELIRMPLEKYEIAKDKNLKEPLNLIKHPPNGDESDFVSYSENDPQKTHIMPSGLSENGSQMWHVIDIKENSSYWIARRNISDRILSLLEDPDKEI